MCTLKSSPGDCADLPGLGNVLLPRPYPEGERMKSRAAGCFWQAQKPCHSSHFWAPWAPGPRRGHASECLNSSGATGWLMGSDSNLSPTGT